MSDSPNAGNGGATARVVRRKARRSSRLLTIVAALCLVGGMAALGTAALLGRQDAPRASAPSDRPAPITPVLSARRVPKFTTAPIPLRALAAAVQPVADAAPPQTCITVGNGEVALYAHNPETALTPASNQKLLTAAAVLAELGPDAKLVTDFRASQEPQGARVEGDLYMVGGGDPLLATDAYQRIQPQGIPPESDLEAIADRLVESGVREISGSVVGDESRYDAVRTVEGWPARWLTNGTVGPISALSVNDSWLIDPVTGEGPGGAANDPAQQAAAVMTRLLSDRGVTIAGPPRSGPTPEGTVSILEVESLPVSAIVGEMLAFSDNTTAEQLLKELGYRTSATGSTAAGIEAVTTWAKAEGLPLEGWEMTDGSGLSSGNRVTCNLLGAILRSAGADGALASGLAVPGSSGTLIDRFDSDEWPDRLRAKTGTLNDVTSLSGWLLTRPESQLDFEMVINTEQRRVNNTDLALQESLLTALLDQPVQAPVDAAGPIYPES